LHHSALKLLSSSFSSSEEEGQISFVGLAAILPKGTFSSSPNTSLRFLVIGMKTTSLSESFSSPEIYYSYDFTDFFAD